MFKKSLKFFSLLLIAVMLTSLGAGAVFAQDMTGASGSGPASALMPANGVVRIGPGEWQWYVFRSQVPFNVKDTEEDVVTSPDQATVKAALYAKAGTVDFEVWSSNDLNNWQNNTDFDPMGQGTTNEFMTGDPLTWQGSFRTNTNSYLIVMNRGSQPAYYSLDITGDVAFPSTLVLNTESQPAETQMAQTQQPAVSSEEMGLTVETPTEAAMAGYGPASALMPANGNVQIEPGQWQWYVFRTQAPFNVEENKKDTIDLTQAVVKAALYVKSGTVDFQVWSLDNLNNWRDNTDFTPMGQGTTNEFVTGDPLTWQGSFRGNVDNYLIVMNHGSQPAVYSLNITGDVTFPTSISLPVK